MVSLRLSEVAVIHLPKSMAIFRVLGFIHDYSQAKMKRRIKRNIIPLTFLNYDWSINSQ